jgi:hypothetical protein
MGRLLSGSVLSSSRRAGTISRNCGQQAGIAAF